MYLCTYIYIEYGGLGALVNGTMLKQHESLRVKRWLIKDFTLNLISKGVQQISVQNTKMSLESRLGVCIGMEMGVKSGEHI